MAQCSAHSKSTGGAQCKQDAIAGGTVCRYHGGAAPQVKNKALERILAAADPVAAELIRLAKKADNEAVRRQACSDLLDRAGIARRTDIQLTGKDGTPLIPIGAIDSLLHGNGDDQ